MRLLTACIVLALMSPVSGLAGTLLSLPLRARRAGARLATAADTCGTARLLVLDTLLPGQLLRCADAPPSFAALVAGSKEPLVCVGRNQLSLHWVGCEAVASLDESGSVVLTASDRLAQIDDDYSDDGGSKWNGRTGRTCLLSVDDSYSLAKAYEHGSNAGLEISPERLARLARDVRALCDEFVSLAGPGVEQLLEQLGPAPEAPNALAVHAAALLNPVDPIDDGVLFIRPAVMTARSTANRLDYAERGLRHAIERSQ